MCVFHPLITSSIYWVKCTRPKSKGVPCLRTVWDGAGPQARFFFLFSFPHSKIMKIEQVFTAVISLDISSMQISQPQHWLPPTHRREGPPELERVSPHVLQTLSPVWFFSITRKRRIVGLSCIHILASLLTCCETVSKVFELSFSSLNWDGKVDLTVVRIEPGS